MIRSGTTGTLQVGLTDDPEAAQSALGYPAGWQLFGPFHSEAAALRWREALASLPGCALLPPGTGWRYGYYCSCELLLAKSSRGKPRLGKAGGRHARGVATGIEADLIGR